MSTDIREIKNALESTQSVANNAQLVATAAQLAANTAQSTSDTNASGIQSALDTISLNASQMVRKFGPVAINASEFTLNTTSTFYEYYLAHGLGDEAPDVEVIDSQREKQLIQSTGVDGNSVKLELTASDITDNEWPLYAIVIGKPGSVLPVAPVAPVGTELQSGFRATLVNQTLSIFSPDGVLLGTTDPDVVGAYFRGGDRVHFSTSGGSYEYVSYPYPSGLEWVIATQADYQLAMNTGLPI